MENKPVNVTDHAYKRGNERLKLSNKSLLKMAGKAFNEGKKHSDFKGRMEKYFTGLYLKNKTANNIRIYGEYVYLFSQNILITVYRVPNELKKYL